MSSGIFVMQIFRRLTRLHDIGMNHEENDFFRSSAAIQRAYAHLFHNSLAVQHIRTKAQAKAISPENKALAFEAVEAAKEALNIVLHNTEYRGGLRFGLFHSFIDYIAHCHNHN